MVVEEERERTSSPRNLQRTYSIPDLIRFGTSSLNASRYSLNLSLDDAPKTRPFAMAYREIKVAIQHHGLHHSPSPPINALPFYQSSPPSLASTSSTRHHNSINHHVAQNRRIGDGEDSMIHRSNFHGRKISQSHNLTQNDLPSCRPTLFSTPTCVSIPVS